jgi:hypothetical protein
MIHVSPAKEFSMSIKRAPKVKVLTAGARSYIDIHPRRGLALTQHLRSHGVNCSTANPSSQDVDSVELPNGLDVKAVQRLLDHWER